MIYRWKPDPPRRHEHYDAEKDTRWACYTDPCLLADAAPEPSGPPVIVVNSSGVYFQTPDGTYMP